MPVERSAGMILFRNNPEGRKYLVIRSSRGASVIAEKKKIKEFWDLPKGVLNSGEKGIEAAIREAKEEVGMGEEQLHMIPEFKVTARYFTRREGKFILKFAAFFLARAKTSKIKLSWEHDQYEWLPYEEACQRLSLPQIQKAVEAAEKFLNAYDAV
jgi:8-oxo-dGTP pyrophosphatase MutT (NUDIX family)